MTKKNILHLDAGEHHFFNNELEVVKSNMPELPHQELKAVRLLPVSQEAPSGADSITARHYDGVGVAKIVADYANDFPRVDAFAKEVTVKVKTLGSSFGYSIPEIRKAQLAKNGLEQRRANFAKRAIDELIERLAWLGDEDHGIKGFLNYPGITQAINPNGKAMKAGTADDAVAKVVELLDAVSVVTNGQSAPNTLLLPPTVYTYLSRTPYGDNKDKTILKFIRENYDNFTTIESLAMLNGAGADGTNRMIAYTMDPDYISLEIPQTFEQLSPQQKAMEFEVPCYAECAGVIVRQPLTVAFMDAV